MTMNKKKLFYVLGAIFLSISITYVTLALVADAKLNAAQSAIKEAGYPTRPSDLIPSAIPVHNNAAIVYESAHSLLKAAGWEEISNKFDNNTEFSPESIIAINAFLQQKNTLNILAVLQQATEKTAWQTVEDYSDGPAILLPHISWHIHPFLNATFHAYLAQDQWDSALNILRINIDYSLRLLKQPFLISHLVSCNHLLNTMKQARLFCNKSGQIPDALLAQTSTLEIHNSLVKSLHAERIFLMDWVFDLRNHKKEFASIYFNSSSSSGSSSSDGGLSFYAMTPLWNLDHAAGTRLSLEMIEYIKKPYTGIKPKLEIASYNYLTKQLTPAHYSCFQSSLTARAELTISKAGLACLRYAKEHGSFPATLELAGSFLDSFSGKPLLYSHTETGFEIISLGKNLDSTDPKSPRWTYTK